MEPVTKFALTSDITGQDGSYVDEFFVAKVFEVHDSTRRSSSFNTCCIKHIYAVPHEATQLHFHNGDVTDSKGLASLISRITPQDVDNLGGQSHV